MPLALELAAARTNLLSVEQILARLVRHHELLTAGARDAPARQQTLRATVDWSYELLNKDEQLAFFQLAVFAGSLSVEAAQAICRLDLDVLASLVDKNMLRWRAGRVSMLETIRGYANDLRDPLCDAADLRRRHVEYFLTFIERDDIKATPPHVAAFIATEYDNFRFALEWAVETAPELALRLAAMLFSTWRDRGELSEGRRWLEETLRRAINEPSRARAGTLGGACWFAYLATDFERCKQLADAAVEMGRDIDDPLTVAFALNTLGGMLTMDESYEDARVLLEEAVAVARAAGDESGLAGAAGNLGIVVAGLGDWTEALALFTEALSLPGVVWPLDGIMHLNIALAELKTGRSPARVAGRYEQVYRSASESGATIYSVLALHGLGLTAARAGHDRSAVHVLGAAAAKRESLGYVLEMPERLVDREAIDQLRACLGNDEFEAEWDEGHRLSPDAAFELALETLRAGNPAR